MRNWILGLKLTETELFEWKSKRKEENTEYKKEPWKEKSRVKCIHFKGTHIGVVILTQKYGGEKSGRCDVEWCLDRDSFLFFSREVDTFLFYSFLSLSVYLYVFFCFPLSSFSFFWFFLVSNWEYQLKCEPGKREWWGLNVQDFFASPDEGNEEKKNKTKTDLCSMYH